MFPLLCKKFFNSYQELQLWPKLGRSLKTKSLFKIIRQVQVKTFHQKLQRWKNSSTLFPKWRMASLAGQEAGWNSNFSNSCIYTKCPGTTISPFLLCIPSFSEEAIYLWRILTHSLVRLYFRYAPGGVHDLTRTVRWWGAIIAWSKSTWKL